MLGVLIVFAMVPQSCSATGDSPPPTAPSTGDVADIASDAYVYGFPLVMNYKVFHDFFLDPEAPSFKAPLNQIHNEARVFTPQDTTVQTPNSDTPYSMVGADLRAEPLVICVPEIDASRYFSIQLVDMYVFNYGYMGTRTTGNGAACYMVAGPGWDGEVPPGISKVFRCETPFSLFVFRTQLFGADDIDNVRRIQGGYQVQTLSEHLGRARPPKAPEIDWPEAGADVFSTRFVPTLNFLLEMLPPVGPAASEIALRDRMASIGIGSGTTVPAEQREAMAEGFKDGMARIEQAAASFGTRVNGWQIGVAAGSREFYDGDWLTRAVASKIGIYGNDGEEATYPFAKADERGAVLDGSKHAYTLTFPADRLPPVNAFWSITMYDARTQFLVDNPIDRYLINSPMLSEMDWNEDGSLTIRIARDSPGKSKEANWLPAPDGPIFMVMRLYWPRVEAPSVLPPGEGSWAPPPIMRVEPAEHAARERIHRRLRPGDKSFESVVRTDERYGSDGLFQGPRGWPYWNDLTDPKPIQNPNLWPDTQSTYFLSQFAMPAGSSMTLRFQYPHARYFQFALYKEQNNTFVSTGQALKGPEIEPDPGSANPFRIGADRHAEDRDFTIRILAEDPPSDPASRPANTLYVGTDGGLNQSVIRIYMPDAGWDGTGWSPATSPSDRPAFDYEGTAPDGTHLNAKEVARRFGRPMTASTDPPLTTDRWVQLVNSPNNDPALEPATAPARPTPEWEKYWTFRYSIVGAFMPPEAQEAMPYAGAIDGGGDPSTQYFFTHLSRQFGPVYVMRGRMPTFPDTQFGSDGTGLATTPEAQVQYWSIVSCEAVPSGRIVDGLCDMQVPLDEDRHYTIVVSRKEDRPANATIENGVAWLEWSPYGEGLDDARNREDFGMLMIRFMTCDPDWQQSPVLVTAPGMEAAVMGDYLPRGEYMTKAQFEAGFESSMGN